MADLCTSPKLKKKQGSIYLYLCNETNQYNCFSRFDCAWSFEHLEIGRTIIESTEYMLAVCALDLASSMGENSIVQTHYVGL